MRLLLVIVAVLGVALATEPVTRYDGYKVFQVTLTERQLEFLAKFENVPGFDIWSRHRVAGAPLDIMVAPAQQSKFVNLLRLEDIPSTIIIEDVQAVFDKEKAHQDSTPKVEGRITFTKYYNHEEINAYLNDMVKAYPKVASIQNIGKSTNGRQMNVLKISSGGSNKPIVWIDAGIHAREWSAPAIALYIINQLLEVTGNEDLYATRDWWILPVANPDGYDWTFTNARLWRKTRSTAVSTACPGVDPNRNWDFHWNEIGASQQPCSDIYSGPRAFSEPENVHIRDYILANKQRIKMYLTFHSYGNYFLYPWGWTSALPSDWKVLDALARKADAAQQAAGGKPYAIGSSTNVLYEAAGASDDWSKGVAGIPLVYTVELPGGGANGFDPPASSIQNMVKTFFPAVRVLGEGVN